MLDAFEVKLLEHANKDKVGDFSKYVKRLIAFDTEGRRAMAAVHPIHAAAETPDAQDEDAEAMMAML